MNNKYSDKIQKILEDGAKCKKLLGPSIGPTGPQGPAGATATNIYGSKYDTVGDVIVLLMNTITPIPLNNVGLTAGISTTDANILTINESGIYKVDYYFQGSTSVDATLTFEVIRNNNYISNTTLIKDFETNIDNSFNGSSIVELTAGDKINLGLDSNVATEVSPSGGVNAYLNIIKLA